MFASDGSVPKDAQGLVCSRQGRKAARGFMKSEPLCRACDAEPKSGKPKAKHRPGGGNDGASLCQCCLFSGRDRATGLDREET